MGRSFLILILFVVLLPFLGGGFHCNVLIDTDSYDSFNGWETPKSFLSGHFLSSLSIPSSISKVVTQEDLLQRKHIPRNSTLCLYGEKSDDVRRVLIARSIWPETEVHVVGIPPIPIVRPSSETLLSPHILRRMISQDSNLLVVHTGEGSTISNEEFIPGSIHLDTNLLESPPIWNLHPCNELYSTFLNYGITFNRTIVLYDKSGCLMSSTRVLMALRSCGVKDVRVLNGGVRSWKRAKFPITSKYEDPKSEEHFGSREWSKRIFVDETFMQEVINDPDSKQKRVFIFDVREKDEFEGNVTGYSFVQESGRIPKSIFWGPEFVALDGESFRPYVEIEAKLERFGVKEEDIVIFYCGTGWRASAIWFILNDLVGFSNAFVYDGGWNEWTRNARNQVV